VYRFTVTSNKDKNDHRVQSILLQQVLKTTYRRMHFSSGEMFRFCDILSQNVATEHIHVRHLAYLPVTVRCLRGSLSVTDSGSHSGPPFQTPFPDFSVTKYKQNFLKRHLTDQVRVRLYRKDWQRVKFVLFQTWVQSILLQQVLKTTFSLHVHRYKVKVQCSIPHVVRGPYFSRGPYARAYRA